MLAIVELTEFARRKWIYDDFYTNIQPVAGGYVREVRIKCKLSLRALGNKTGVSFTYLSKVENGKEHLSPELARKLVEVYEELNP